MESEGRVELGREGVGCQDDHLGMDTTAGGADGPGVLRNGDGDRGKRRGR